MARLVFLRFLKDFQRDSKELCNYFDKTVKC